MVSPIIDMPSSKHSGVSGIPTQLLVLHSGECPLRGGYAQSLTNWANGPGVEASWHWFIDPIARVRMVEEQYAAWHATWANSLSEGFEQAGYARFTLAEWTTSEGLKQLENVASTLAERCKANDIPARWLTTAEVNAVRAGNRTTKGLCTHAQVDPASRTDPGSNYPYGLLLERIKFYLGETAINTQSTTATEQDDDMKTIFSDSGIGDGKVWIGDGITRRHIKDPAELAAMQLLAAEGKLSLFKNGAVQNLPANCMGIDVEATTARAVVREPFTYLDPETGKPKGTTTIGAALGAMDFQFVATRKDS